MNLLKTLFFLPLLANTSFAKKFLIVSTLISSFSVFADKIETEYICTASIYEVDNGFGGAYKSLMGGALRTRNEYKKRDASILFDLHDNPGEFNQLRQELGYTEIRLVGDLKKKEGLKKAHAKFWIAEIDVLTWIGSEDGYKVIYEGKIEGNGTNRGTIMIDGVERNILTSCNEYPSSTID